MNLQLIFRANGAVTLLNGVSFLFLTESDLESAFAEHGAVDSARIISDRATGRSKVVI